MNISFPISWLRDYLKTDVAAKTLANALSLSGPSVERLTKKGDDFIFDIEVTTNRTDAYSVYGIAREGAAILQSQGLKSTLTEPKGLRLNLDPEQREQLKLDVIIRDQGLCPRFSAIVLSNVKIQPSPAYIRNRLESSGIRAINNIVDISNYIMLELGQPMHAFDFDKVKGSKMTLRKSKKGELLKTLDGTTHKLPEESIIIEDSAKLIDLCGIMGGANSAVSKRTKRIILFVQAYNPRAIRKTTQTLAFRTEASSRFEKGIDIEGTLPALSRAVFLAKQTAGAKIASELIDIYPRKLNIKTIRLNLNKLDNYLGINLEPNKSAKILKSLGFETKLQENQITTYVPPWRMQDVQDDVDLIEEIARIYGYYKLPSKLPTGEIPQTTDSILKKVIDLKKTLKHHDLTEVITYSIISRELLLISGKSEKSGVELANPLTNEWQFMRPSLIPSLLQIIAKNQANRKNLQIFEIAKTYLQQKGDLPQQDLMLSICSKNTSFYQIKGLIENVSNYLQRKVKFQKLQKTHPFMENTQSTQIKISEGEIGFIGAVKNEISDKFEIDGKVWAAEINLTKIYAQPNIPPSYKPIPKYPPVIEDISAIVAKILPLEELIDEIEKTGTSLLKKTEVVDVFEDPKFGLNKKSVTLRLTFQKTTGTPTLQEANFIKEKIISHLEKTLRAKIRK